MKSLFRIFVLAALVLIVGASPALTTRAQGMTLCPTGLTADDCALLTAATVGGTTFTMDYNLIVKTTGTPQDIDLQVKGNGPIDFTNVKAADATNPSAAVKNLVMQNTLTASMTQGTKTQSGNFEFRIVGGNIYFQGDNAPLVKGTWYKQDLTKGMGTGSMNMIPANLTNNPLMKDPQAIAQIVKVVGNSLSGAVTDGPTMEGAATKQITVSLDVESLVKDVSSPDGMTMLAGIAKTMGSPIPDAQLKQAQTQIQQFVTLLDPTLKATTVQVDWVIDPAKKQFRGFGLVIKTTVDASTASLLGGTSQITADIEFNVALTQIGAAVSVDTPADAKDASTIGK